MGAIGQDGHHEGKQAGAAGAICQNSVPGLPGLFGHLRVHHQREADLVASQMDLHDHRRRSSNEECQVETESNAQRVLLD